MPQIKNINTAEYWDKKWSGVFSVDQVPYQNEVDYVIANWVRPNLRVLEIGCGAGTLMLRLREAIPDIDIIGLDISTYAVKITKAHGFNAEVAKVPPIPFKDNSFDLVIAEELIEHIDEDDELLKEMIRVGKECIISTPNGLMKDENGNVIEEHVNYYNEIELRNKLKELGQKFEFKKRQGRLLFRFANEDEFIEPLIKSVHLGLACYKGFESDSVISLLTPYAKLVGNLQEQFVQNAMGKSGKIIVPNIIFYLPQYIGYFSSCNMPFTRNDIVNKFLEMDAEYLFFFDSDMEYDVSRIKDLIDADKDMIGGLYNKRMPGEVSTIARLTKDYGMIADLNWPVNQLYACDGLGMGATIIKREVFLAMDSPYFEYLFIGQGKMSREPFKGGRMTGSDWSFCWKAKQKYGFQIYVDTSFVCSHIGKSKYRPTIRGEIL